MFEFKILNIELYGVKKYIIINYFDIKFIYLRSF